MILKISFIHPYCGQNPKILVLNILEIDNTVLLILIDLC